MVQAEGKVILYCIRFGGETFVYHSREFFKDEKEKCEKQNIQYVAWLHVATEEQNEKLLNGEWLPEY